MVGVSGLLIISCDVYNSLHHPKIITNGDRVSEIGSIIHPNTVEKADIHTWSWLEPSDAGLVKRTKQFAMLDPADSYAVGHAFSDGRCDYTVTFAAKLESPDAFLQAKDVNGGNPLPLIAAEVAADLVRPDMCNTTRNLGVKMHKYGFEIEDVSVKSIVTVKKSSDNMYNRITVPYTFVISIYILFLLFLIISAKDYVEIVMFLFTFFFKNNFYVYRNKDKYLASKGYYLNNSHNLVKVDWQCHQKIGDEYKPLHITTALPKQIKNIVMDYITKVDGRKYRVRALFTASLECEADAIRAARHKNALEYVQRYIERHLERSDFKDVIPFAELVIDTYDVKSECGFTVENAELSITEIIDGRDKKVDYISSKTSAHSKEEDAKLIVHNDEPCDEDSKMIVHNEEKTRFIY